MRLIISPGAERDLGRLSRDIAVRVASAIDQLPQNPRPPGCLLLRDYEPPTWRIRVGAWRVLYEIDDGAGIVRIRGVHHRSKAY
jgi:mRNA interferase RelE/StbE